MLPGPAQLLLRAAAADAGCSLAELCEVASAVSGRAVTEADIQPAIDARLVRLDGDRLVFSHPLIAAAIYQSMTVGDRQRIHWALAHVIPAGVDRRVWHQAASVLGPDDAVAAELEALAGRADRRGAVTVSIAALDRAAGLVTDKARQADLRLRSAELAAELGRGQLALDLLARAGIAQVEPFGHARSLIIREAVRPGLAGAGPSVAELVAAALDTQAAGDTDLAASVLWTAASRCWYSVLYADAMLASDEAALDRFEVALAADPGGSGLAEARLQLAYGSWLRRHRRMREARAALAQAHAIFAGLGTEGFAYRATRELHAAGAAPPAAAGRRPAPAHPAGAADRAARGPWPVQPADRRAAVPVAPHGGIPPLPPVPEARDQHARTASGRAEGRGTGTQRPAGVGRDRPLRVMPDRPFGATVGSEEPLTGGI